MTCDASLLLLLGSAASLAFKAVVVLTVPVLAEMPGIGQVACSKSRRGRPTSGAVKTVLS